MAAVLGSVKSTMSWVGGDRGQVVGALLTSLNFALYASAVK